MSSFLVPVMTMNEIVQKTFEKSNDYDSINVSDNMNKNSNTETHQS